VKYAQSKAGNILIASEYARRHKEDGIISMSLNPGNLKSGLQRHTGKVVGALNHFILHDAIYGAYTELYAGLSPDVGFEQSGSYIIPWGRVATLKKDLVESVKSEEEGGSGMAAKFWDWCVTMTKPYV